MKITRQAMSGCILVVLIGWSCIKDVGPIDPDIDLSPYPILAADNLDDLWYVMTDYDCVEITHRAGPIVVSGSIVAVEIGMKDSAGFAALARVEAIYDLQSRTNLLEFFLSAKLDSTRITVPLCVRYCFADSSVVDVDTLYSTLAYPYPSTEVIVGREALPGWAYYYQDIDRIGDKLYIHPIGPFGMYEYDFNSRTTTMLVAYSGGDHIAADSIYVFCDLYHRQVHRFNTLTNTVDLVFDLPSTADIYGLEAYNGHVYVYLPDQRPGNVLRYTYAGVLVDSLTITIGSWSMTIHDDILYLVYGSELQRFDIATMTSLPSVAAPGRYIEGIKAYGDLLYFSHYTKVFVGSVPFAELAPRSTVAQRSAMPGGGH